MGRITIMEKMEKSFRERDHLNEAGVALCVDALKLNTLEQLPPKVRDHVDDCHECKKEITALFALLDDVDYTDVRSHPLFRLAHGTGSRVPQLLKIAAVVAGVASLATLAYYMGPFRQGQTSGQEPDVALVGPADSAQKAHDSTSGFQKATNEEIAADFAVDPGLEDMVNGRVRSAAFRVISPANGSVLGADRVFSWKGEGRGPLTLSFMNNAGSVVLTESVPSSRYVLRAKLRPGVYYWKIESESELLCVGKFLVK